MEERRSPASDVRVYVLVAVIAGALLGTLGAMVPPLGRLFLLTGGRLFNRAWESIEVPLALLVLAFSGWLILLLADGRRRRP